MLCLCAFFFSTMFHLMRLVLVNAPLPRTYKSDSILILTVSSHTSQSARSAHTLQCQRACSKARGIKKVILRLSDCTKRALVRQTKSITWDDTIRELHNKLFLFIVSYTNTILVLVLLKIFKDYKIPSSVPHFRFPDLVTWLLYL